MFLKGIVPALFLFTASCNNPAPNTREAAPVGPVTGDNSATSLDWFGVYRGVLPCADCQGIDMEITLNKDLTYTRTTNHLGKGKGMEEKGSFAWDSTGNQITLGGSSGAFIRYRVGENNLLALDTLGQRFTRTSGVNYMLKKK